jgi:hypothetical protein
MGSPSVGLIDVLSSGQPLANGFGQPLRPSALRAAYSPSYNRLQWAGIRFSDSDIFTCP